IRENTRAARVVTVRRVRRADDGVVPVAGSDGGLAVDGGGKVAVQVALIAGPIDAERQRFLVEGVDREPVMPAPSVPGAGNRVLPEDGIDTAERREGGVAGRAQVEERGIGGEVDRERDR